jgi:hypothetical protein
MDTMLRAQNMDQQSPHFGAIHTAFDYGKGAFDSDDRGANRGWKPDIVAHMVRYMLLTWEEVKAREGLDRRDWYEAAVRAGEWILRQQNADGGLPQVIWNDTGKPSNSVVSGRALLALPVLSRITGNPEYAQCLKGMEAFLMDQVEGRYCFTGAHPDLWPNDFEQDSIWCAVEYWLDKADRTGDEACVDRAAADAYLSFLWWCPKQLSWVQNPTQAAHCEQQHYTQYSVYCYHNRKVQCLDRLARKTRDPLFRNLADRAMQLNFYTQLTQGDQTGAFYEAIADPWGERGGGFNFTGTPYMNELSLDMMLQIVDMIR